MNALRAGDVKTFASHLRDYLEQAVSFHDLPKRLIKRTRHQAAAREASDITVNEQQQAVDKTREEVYHAFMLGLLAGLHSQYFQLSSNREAGYSRYDIVLMPDEVDQQGLIFEFKGMDDPSKLPQEAKSALQQIEVKRYAAALEARGVRSGLHIGLAFCGKRFHLDAEQVTYDLSPEQVFRLPESPYRDQEVSPAASPPRAVGPAGLSVGTSQSSFFIPPSSKGSAALQAPLGQQEQ